MKYQIPLIQNKEQIHTCEKLPISFALWNTAYTPVSYGQVAVLENEGFIVKLTSLEKNPLCTYKNNNDPVFKDSALEFFLQPDPENKSYLNFEMNANGACLLQLGSGRSRRKNLPRELISLCPVAARREDDQWSVILTIPYDFLKKAYPSSSCCFEKLNSFRFNLFKISEDEDYLHFISLTNIESPEPNFHLPAFFAGAEVVR